jgi:phospholipid/cholesterol/gamma-HCH transport system substrate-binding protein
VNRRRTVINVVTFVLLASFLVWFGVTRFLLPPEAGQRITMEVTDAGGLLPRSDVTVRGVPGGVVERVDLTGQGTALVTVALDPGVTVTEGTVAEITRRSPIGDLTVDLIPGPGPALPNGGHIPIENTSSPPDPERTIEVLAQLLSAVPPQDLDTVVTEAATALRGRGRDLASLSESGADLPERILEVRTQLESLLRTGPEVLDVLAANAPTLADDLVQTAVLADILRDRRYDLVDLTANGARFAEVFGELLADEKPNIACLVSDFGRINRFLAKPDNLKNLVDVLDLNHYFFGGADQAVQHGKDDLYWFRVHFLPPQQPAARGYHPTRKPPDVLGGDGCTSRYGPGVGPATQAHDPYTAPGSQLHRGT